MMKKGMMIWVGIAMTALCLNLTALPNAKAAGEEGNWKISMTYSGGYSPIKEVRIEILKAGNDGSFSAEKIYYDNTPPVKKEGSVTTEQFNALIGELEKNEAWTLPDLEEYVATDGFTYHVQVENGGKKHAFQVYFPELQKDTRYVNVINAISSITGDL